MKTIVLLLVTALLCSITTNGSAADKSAHATAHGVRHVVCIKFKEGTSHADIKAMEKEFIALKGKVDGMTAFEHGVNNSPEQLNKGFTNCYIATFKDVGARDTYLTHPAHQEFVAKHLKPIMEDAFVIDFGGQ